MELLPTLWVQKYKIKNEAGLPIELDQDHYFMRQILNDMSPLQVILKAPQIGMTVSQIIKTMFVAKKEGRDIIYTLPTAADVNDMAGGKINRLIAQNPILQQWVKEHDTVEQKTVGKNIIYYRGTFSTKQAMMVSSQLNVHDEVDASNQEVITQYETRLQATTDGWRWYFSHPSLAGNGVDKYWEQSDKKHWFVTCPACKLEQFLGWPDSVDPERECYICKGCQAELSDDTRRFGEWKPTAQGAFSGYWVPQLMCAWIPAAKVLQDFEEKPEDYFYNFVLGLPYVGGGNKVIRDDIMGNLTSKINEQKGRIVIGLDTGLPNWATIGNQDGLFYYGPTNGYEEVRQWLRRWPNSILVADAGGDLVGSRQLKEDFPGRVFLCHFSVDRKTMELIRWGEHEEFGNVIADRNRMIQLVVDEFKSRRIPLQGDEKDWHDYWLHFDNIYRTVEENKLHVLERKWERKGPDHLVLATVYWRIGMDRFGGSSGLVIAPPSEEPDPVLVTDEGMMININFGKNDDWRN